MRVLTLTLVFLFAWASVCAGFGFLDEDDDKWLMAGASIGSMNTISTGPSIGTNGPYLGDSNGHPIGTNGPYLGDSNGPPIGTNGPYLGDSDLTWDPAPRLGSGPQIRRRRRLFQAHGNWCGPNWTGGRKISAYDYWTSGGSFYAYCIDKTDCICRTHDYDCARHYGCCKSDTSKMINALKRAGDPSPWIRRAMQSAYYAHKDC